MKKRSPCIIILFNIHNWLSRKLVVEAAHVPVSDEDLGHGAPTAAALDHLVQPGGVGLDVPLGPLLPLGLEQCPSPIESPRRLTPSDRGASISARRRVDCAPIDAAPIIAAPQRLKRHGQAFASVAKWAIASVGARCELLSFVYNHLS